MGITIYGGGRHEAQLFREIAPRFGVVPRITQDEISERNTDLALGNRCVSVGHKTHVSYEALRALGRAGVEYISTRSIGCNHIDVEYAQRVGITVGTVAYSPDSVADYTLMLMLMLVRNAQTMLRRADSHDYRLDELPGKELRDLTIGVIGTGRIGAAVIARLEGFGCQILTHDRRPVAQEHVPLDDLLQRSDLVTLHTPLSGDTHHLLDERRLARMKRGASIVNTGRGALVDTEALVRALESGRLRGAALDVLEGEEGIFYADWQERQIDNAALLRLQRLPNVIVSPHAAYFTEHALRDIVESTLLNCLTFEGRQGRG